MAKKRNVNAESHLLTGGLLTGFFAFMGFGPGTAASAVITGAVVAKDVSKAKREEDFECHFEVYQGTRKNLDEQWYYKERLLHELEHFSPMSEDYLEQVELEKLFENARIVEEYEYINKKYSFSWSVKEMIEKAKVADDRNKIVQRKYERIINLILENGDKCIVFSRLKYPDKFREKCIKAGIPFKSYDYYELQDLKKQLFIKHYEGRNFDFSKYR